MKKTAVTAIAIAAALVVLLAATAVYIQYQSPQAGSGQTTSAASTTSATSSGSGQLAVMGTDPPTSASGVSDASVHYSSVYAHTAGTDMASGWTQVSGSGNLDLMASGTAQTMATSHVAAGDYDAFRFNVDSAQVTYQGHQYIATVASTTVTATSTSRVHVNSSSTAVAVVDMRTFLINTGNTSTPQFIFSATAVSTAAPSSAFSTITLNLGGTASLSGSWWTSFEAQTNNQVNLAATMTINSMALHVQNSGSANAQIQEVIVTPVSASYTAGASLPASLSGSAVFTTDGSGSLQSTTSLQSAALLTSGTQVSSGSSATLNYSGNISLDFGLGSLTNVIVQGQSYVVTVVGANTYASTVVVAS